MKSILNKIIFAHIFFCNVHSSEESQDSLNKKESLKEFIDYMVENEIFEKDKISKTERNNAQLPVKNNVHRYIYEHRRNSFKRNDNQSPARLVSSSPRFKIRTKEYFKNLNLKKDNDHQDMDQ